MLSYTPARFAPMLAQYFQGRIERSIFLIPGMAHQPPPNFNNIGPRSIKPIINPKK